MTDRETRATAGAGVRARQLRIAVAGGGKMGQHHMRAIQRLGDFGTLVAVADPSPAAREGLASVAPGARTYSTLDELIARESIDVLHVCTAPQTHEQIARQAIEAGCNVYVEKPFVETAEQAERLVGLAASRGVRLCAGHQLLYEAPARRALELLPALGTPIHLQSFFAFRPVRRTPDGRVPMRADLQLLDILPHPVYLLLSFLEAAVPQGQTVLSALDVGPGGTVHALVRRGGVTGSLVVTLDGRPVDSYVRVVGTNGSVHADFVRGTVQRLIGPGTSGIDKALIPYRLARQVLSGTTSALLARVMKRQRSYPGLTEIFAAFYAEISTSGAPAVTADSIIETVRICEEISRGLRREGASAASVAPDARILVTGGTGLLGKEVVEALVGAGEGVRVVSRRSPPVWESGGGAEHVTADLSAGIPASAFDGIETIVHCAAETAGGWAEHQRNSLDATERLMRGAAAAGVRRFIHISSLAVQAEPGGGQALRDDSPLEPDPRARGPYVWGKLESECLAVRLGEELGLDVRIVRPGALVDYRRFEPPGRLGKRLGNIFVAVGSPHDQLGVVEVDFAGRAVAWIARSFEEAPTPLNLLAPALPTRGSLIGRLRRSNPDLTVIWLPRIVLRPLSLVAIGLQKLLRPGKPAMDVAKVFASGRYDTTRVASLVSEIEAPAATRIPARLANLPSASAAVGAS